MLGTTIKDYVRKRRLSLAVYDLQNSSDTITDIAFKYNFNSYDSFCKAFYNQHGVTPTQARNKDCEVNIFPPAIFEINVKGATKIKFQKIYVAKLATDLSRKKKFGLKIMNTILKEFVTDMTDYGTVFLIMANIQSREKRKI